MDLIMDLIMDIIDFNECINCFSKSKIANQLN